MDNAENEVLDQMRRDRLQEINANPDARSGLEAKYGKVWNTDELRVEFEVLGFAAPFIVVMRRSDRKKGTLEFQHHPRFYFGFELHG